MTKYKMVFFLLYLMSINLHAASMPSIAVLEFDLKDLTLKPGVPAEINRTASIKPLLEGELRSAGYQITDIPLSAQKEADSGVGYLFDHADVVAKLGRKFGADYVLVGRLHKPSFLFAYVMGDLVRVSDAQLVGKFISESKGPNAELTIKAVESLTAKIDNVLEHRYTPPPPKTLSHSNTSAGAEVPSEKPLTLAFGDAQLKWGSCPPIFPKGCEIAVLHGDLAKPNADVFLKVPANYTIPSHWHNSAERMVLVSGEFYIEYTGHSPSVLKPGTYAYGPIKAPHKASCTDSGPCVLFIAFESPVDAHLTEDSRK
jgi:anti-sigma factor ChrR (cupin superfamily)